MRDRDRDGGVGMGGELGEISIGRLSAAVWTQPKCRATILPGLRWRESRGCWPALQHSWNSKQQSQELKHYTQASHTPPPISTARSLVFFSLTSSPLFDLTFSCSSSSSSSSSYNFHPPPLPSNPLLPIESLPHLYSTSSGARRRGYGLIWIFECISTSSSLGRGVVLRSRSCGGVMGPSAQGSLS